MKPFGGGSKGGGKHARGYQQPRGRKAVKTAGKIKSTGRHAKGGKGGSGKGGAADGLDRWG